MRLVTSLAVSAAIMAISQLPSASAQEPYIGEIREFPYTFCPRGWAEAKGQLLPISENTALFSLLGTNYGGDGRTTFGLPDFSAPPTPTNSSPAPAGGEARVFQHCNYAGWSAPLGLGEYKAGDLPDAFLDNDASSVRLSPGWEVTLYDGPNLDGQSVTLSGDNACFVDIGMNDKVSSLVVRRTETPAPAPQPSGPAVKTCIALTGIYPSRS